MFGFIFFYTQIQHIIGIRSLTYRGIEDDFVLIITTKLVIKLDRQFL